MAEKEVKRNSGGQDSVLPMQEAWVWSLIRELRSQCGLNK